MPLLYPLEILLYAQETLENLGTVGAVGALLITDFLQDFLHVNFSSNIYLRYMFISACSRWCIVVAAQQKVGCVFFYHLIRLL